MIIKNRGLLKWLPTGGSDMCYRADFPLAARNEVAAHPESAGSVFLSSETLTGLACYKSSAPAPSPVT